MEVLESDPRQVWQIAERCAVNNAYAPGSNYTFAVAEPPEGDNFTKRGTVLDPEAKFVGLVANSTKLHLIIR